MKETDAYEQAYKNGYENGKRDTESNIVHCKDCKYLMFSDFYGECGKALLGIVNPNDYCSHGERGEKE